MSRQAHLPPRCPFQKKNITGCHPPTLNDAHLRPRHQKSVSQSYAAEEKPAWLDDLLDESDSNSSSSGSSHRRSASDSLTLLDSLAPLKNLQRSGTDNSTSCKTDAMMDSASSLYGPNSPRAKGNLGFPEDEVVSALSKYISQEHQWQIKGNLSLSGATYLDSLEDTCASPSEAVAEAKAAKRYSTSRHPGQRSRVRKLQYIAELEKTVGVLQKVETDMTSRVAALLQQRLALSLENNKLKQQAAKLQREKQLVDGQYKCLRKEVERLKYLAYAPPDNKVGINFRRTRSAELGSSDPSWSLLDMEKLDLN